MPEPFQMPVQPQSGLLLPPASPTCPSNETLGETSCNEVTGWRLLQTGIPETLLYPASIQDHSSTAYFFLSTTIAPPLPQPTLLTVMLELHCSLCNPSGKCTRGTCPPNKAKQSARAWLIPDVQKQSSAKLETIHRMMWTASCFQNLQPCICSHIAFNSPGIYWGRKGREKVTY